MGVVSINGDPTVWERDDFPLARSTQTYDLVTQRSSHACVDGAIGCRNDIAIIQSGCYDHRRLLAQRGMSVPVSNLLVCPMLRRGAPSLSYHVGSI